jgi:hypothetical protein
MADKWLGTMRGWQALRFVKYELANDAKMPILGRPVDPTRRTACRIRSYPWINSELEDRDRCEND